MARDPQKLRKAYEYKLGKDLVAKLSDDQITQLSKYYNSLPPDQQSKVDSEIVMGKGDFLDTARSMADPIKNPVKDDTLAQKYLPEDKFVDDTQEKLDEKLSETSDSIMDEIDRIIEEYNKKVASYKETKEEEEEKIPEGLDDLLNDIKEETKKEVGGEKSSSALAVIPKKIEEKGEELVDEDIDPRILKLLGIEDTTGLDYSDYKTLLKEKMTADRMSGQDVDSGDAELISNEFKRVKGSTGKFKVNGQKIKTESFVGKKKTTEPVSKVRRSLLMPSPSVRVDQPIKDEGQSNDEIMGLLVAKLNAVDKNVQNTAENLKQKDEIEEKEKEKDRIAAGKVEDSRREEKIERKNVLGNIVKGVKKGVKPIGDMLGGLFDFFKKIGFSIFIMELLRFLENPAKFINGIVKWMNKQIEKLEKTIEDFVINNLVAPINSVIDGFNQKVKEFVDFVNPIFAQLQKIGIDAQFDANSMMIPRIDPKSIRDGFNIPKIPNVPDDFLGGGFGGSEETRTITPEQKTTNLQEQEATTADAMRDDSRVSPQTPMVGDQSRTRQTTGSGDQVRRTVFSAGHFNTGFNSRGIPIGSDNVPVSGTTDPGTGVAEYQATKHLIGTLKMLVDEKGLGDKIGFENITSMRGLRGVPSRVESTPGTQFVDLHFDQHAQGGTPGSAGRSGIISRNLSPVDKALAAEFGDFGRNFRKGDVGVAEAGGTILELAAIDDPKIIKLLKEVKSGKQGPESRAMAERILKSVLSGMGGSSQTQPAPEPSSTLPLSKTNFKGAQSSLPKPVNPPVSNVSVASMTLPGAGVKVDNSISSAGASQTPVLAFSATDPTNLSVISAKSTYGVVV